MKMHSFIGKGPISFINFLTEFKHSCHPFWTHQGAASLLFRNFITIPRFAAIKARLVLSSNDVNRYCGAGISCPEFVNHLLRWYATDAVIAKTNEIIRIFKQGRLTPWHFSHNLCDSTLCCSGHYNEPTLRGFFAEEIDLSTRNDMRHSLLGKQLRGYLRTLDESCPVPTGSGRHDSSWSREKDRPRLATPSLPKWEEHSLQVIAVQSSGTPSTIRKTRISESVSCNVINPVPSALSKNGDDSDSTFMNSGEYCRVFKQATTRPRSVAVLLAPSSLWNRTSSFFIQELAVKEIMEDCIRPSQPIK